MKSKITILLLCVTFLAQAQMKRSTKTSGTATATATPSDFKPTILAPSRERSAPAANVTSPLEAFKGLDKPGKMMLGRDVEILRDAAGDIIMLQGTRDFSKVSNRSTEQKAAAYLEAVQADLGFRQINENFELNSNETDEIGQTHVRFSQVHKGVHVYGAEIILHSNEGDFAVLNGRFYPTPDILDVNPSLSIASAKEIVEKDLAAKEVELVENHFVKEKFKSELVIYHKNRDKNAERLAYHVTILPNAMARYEYFVDAKTGEIIHDYNHTCNFVGHQFCNHQENQTNEKVLMDGSADASAADLFGVKRDLKSYLSSGSYYMIDVSRPMFKLTQSKMPEDPVGAIQTLDAFNTSPEKTTFKYDNVTSLDNKWTSKATAISAHYNAGLAYDYYKKTFARESINGKGGTIISLINIVEKNGGSMENAFWNGEAMFYGNGGSSFSSLARGLDVAGHEMSHGVIQNTANLEYENESGAMNESFADIFGAMIDRDDWKIGEDVVKLSAFPTGALRDLENPNNGGTNLNSNGWQPKNMSEKYKGTDDNGGVHINSGITNFAFFKYATALNSKDKAEQVFYRALTKYLVKSSQFIDLRAAATQAATDLYGAGTKEVTEVANAFTAVGIGSGGSTTGGGYQKDVAVNPGSDIVAFTDVNSSNISLYYPAKNTVSEATKTPINSRPSVTDDGSYMVFVAADKSIHGISFDWTKGGAVNEEVISTDKVWKNAVISKDGDRLAATLAKDDNQIYVFDFTKNPVASKVFTLTNPTYTTGVATGDVQYADAMEFDVTGDNLMYDAFNSIKGTNGNIEYWDIGFARVFNSKAKAFGDGKIQKLFSNLKEGTSVGNPIFSKNSPYIIAFDYQEEFDQNKTYVMTANLQTGKTGEIYYNGKDLPSYPCFSRLDDKLVFETKDAVGYFAGVIELNADKLSPKVKDQVGELIDKGYWPIWFSNGKRVLVGANDLAQDVFKVYPNPFNESIQVSFTSLSQKNYQIIDMTGRVLLSGIADNQDLTLDLGFLPQGTYILKAGGGVQKIMKF
jgi:bacillolysin